MVSVPVESIPKYEQLAPRFKEMSDRGASIQTIAAAHGMCWDQAKMILHFAETGERPKWPSKKKEAKNKQPIQEKYLTHCHEVVRLRDEGESFARISMKLGICESTVRRAWDHTHMSASLSAAESGASLTRGKYRHIPAETVRELRALALGGELTIREIAARTGVSQSTVRRERHLLVR